MATEAKEGKKLNWMSVLKNTGVVILGVIVGKVAGSAVGRPSGIIGTATTGLGFVLLDKVSDKKWIGYFTIGAGAGMLASPVMEVAPSSVKGLSGLAAVAEDAKAGSSEAINSLARKFWLDKTPLAKFLPNSESVNGLGDTDLTDEDAQRVIDEMIAERASGVNGMDGDLMEDYGINGNLLDDYNVGDLSDIDEDDLGRGPFKRFFANHPKINKAQTRFLSHHPKLNKAHNRFFNGTDDLEEVLEGTINEDFGF